MTMSQTTRLVAAAALWLAFACQATAQPAAPAEVETIPLWPKGSLPSVVSGPERVGSSGSASGAVTNVSEPRLEIHRAAQPNGTAALIVGGGGFFRIQVGTAARPMAQWLASIGVTSAVLYYRLPADGWPASAPYADGQRAMRILRENAQRLGIDPGRIGIIGSSAGANLAGIVATRWEHPFYDAVDAADQRSARPDFAGLLYPVVSVQAPLDDTRTAREVSTQPDAASAYSVENHVRPDMPPVFIAQSVDDPIVDAGHGVLMYQVARKAGVPVELHMFENGGHSWGVGKPGSLPAQWPRLFATWARSHGFMGAPPPRLQPLPGATPQTPGAAGAPPPETPASDIEEED